MSLSLEQRLLRMLRREEDGEARSARDLRALPAQERVLEGECIQGAVFSRQAGQDQFVFEAPENMSKFRAGDSVLVGDGLDFEAALSMEFHSYDADRDRLTLSRDPWARGQRYEFEAGQEYCVDRRALSVRGRLQQVVESGFANPLIRAVLEGTHEVLCDEDRKQRAREALGKAMLNDVQVRAGASAIATQSLAMVQGPPGTGKTRLLAEILQALCGAGCRIALSAFTHRAVDNALLALRRRAPDLQLFKLGAKNDEALLRAGVQSVNPRRGGLPQASCVVAGTCFALAKLPEKEVFHFTVFDEAGQLPIPHAMAGMLLAKRWIFVGDHAQLPPVITAHHADRGVTVSIFEHLHDKYGSEMLDVTYRMNGPLSEVVGDAFYGGLLKSADPDRRMPFKPGGVYDEILSPDEPVVIARVDHLQPGTRSPQEANLIGELVYELRNQHEIPAAEIAVLAPFRAQVRLCRSAMQRRGVPDQDSVVVDTVERMQGQEREVILISLAVGDPDTLSARAAFFFSTNRLNVAMSRARTKVVLVASEGAFRGLPMDPESLRAASLFKSMFRSLPHGVA